MTWFSESMNLSKKDCLILVDIKWINTSESIVEFNTEFKITQANEASAHMFDLKKEAFANKQLKELFSAKSYSKLQFIIPQHTVLSNKYDSLHIN